MKMLYLCFVIIIIIVYGMIDVNYVVRTYFTVLSGRLYQASCALSDSTTIYGICTFQDCDISFKRLRLARLLREVDFARYHFYDRTGIYGASRRLQIRSLQGSTLATCTRYVPLFAPYKITTKLVYWDARSLFLEHSVTTLRDNALRWRLVSRQYALGDGHSVTALLAALSAPEAEPECPEYIRIWLQCVHSNRLTVNSAA